MNRNINDLISVILPTYNDIFYLKKAIESILNQNYINFELIIVDDGSTDKTEQYIKSINDKRIIYIYQSNKKLPAALNTGHNIAKGKYITWTSSDNIVKINWLFTLHNAIINNDFVYSAYSIIDKDDKNCDLTFKKTDKEYIIMPPIDTKEQIEKYNCIGASFMYSNTFYKKIGGYNENLEGIEDYEMWYRMMKHCTPILISESLYFYRIHENSMTTKKRKETRLKLNEFHKTKRGIY